MLSLIHIYHDSLRRLNVLPPSIEPLASGHIIEQIQLVQQILDAGYAYVCLLYTSRCV